MPFAPRATLVLETVGQYLLCGLFCSTTKHMSHGWDSHSLLLAVCTRFKGYLARGHCLLVQVAEHLEPFLQKWFNVHYEFPVGVLLCMLHSHRNLVTSPRYGLNTFCKGQVATLILSYSIVSMNRKMLTKSISMQAMQ